MLIRRACAGALIAILVACGNVTSREVQAPAGASSVAFTAGIPPVATLPNAAAPIRAALRGSTVVLLARELSDARLNLYELDPAAGSFRTTRLDLEDAGVWAGLGIDDTGAAWVAVRDTLLRVDPTGAIDRFTMPPVQFALPTHMRLPEPSGPTTSPFGGLATSLAVVGDLIVIGRTDAVELLIFDRTTRHFRQVPLPAGTGDVAEIVAGPRNSVVFTVMRSGRTPGLLNDVIGLADPLTGVVRTVLLPARGIAATANAIAVGGVNILVTDPDGRPVRPPALADRYDIRRVVLRADASVLVRVNGSHELAVVDLSGRESDRIVYAVPIVKLMRGDPQPYNSSLSYAIAAPDNSVWFSLDGRPEVYRVR